MKIFSWMHRKHHANVDYSMISREKDHDTFYEDDKKPFPAVITCEKDTELLLRVTDRVTVVDSFGLLAIGTLGFDPFRFQEGYSVGHEEYSVEEDDEEEEEDDEEEEEEEEVEVVTPLAVTAFKREVKIMERDQLEAEMPKSRPVAVNVAAADDPAVPLLQDDEEKKKKGERTTLADLFNAEAANKRADKCNAPEISADTGKKAKQHVRSLAKKLMPWKAAEDSRPTTKLHRLMRKMLKRKIHPDIERKIHGGFSADDASENEAVLSDPSLKINSSAEAGGNDSISLLQSIKESSR